MKLISLTRGYFAMVDDEDFAHLNQFKWSFAKGRHTTYARRSASVSEHSTRKTILMHREILGLKYSEMDVDHKDRDGLNNQKSNIRACTKAENSKNRKAWGVSKYVGVCHHISGGKIKWRATISINKKCIHIGLFDSQEKAAIAYNEKAKQLHGEFANLNTVL